MPNKPLYKYSGREEISKGEDIDIVKQIKPSETLDDKLKKLKLKLQSMSDHEDKKECRDEDRLKRKIKQQKKDIENLSREIKDLQDVTKNFLAPTSSIKETKEFDISISPLRIPKSIISDKQYIETVNILESKVEENINEKAKLIEKSTKEKLEAEKITSKLQNDLAKKKEENEKVVKERELLRDEIKSLRTKLIELSKRHEESELSQQVLEKLIEKEREKVKRKITANYQKEVDNLKRKISNVNTELKKLKSGENSIPEINELRDELCKSKQKHFKALSVIENITSVVSRQKVIFEELERVVNCDRSKIPSLEDIAKASQLYTRIFKDYEELNTVLKNEESVCFSHNQDFDKLKQLLDSSLEREKELEDSLAYTISLNCMMNTELESNKKTLTELERIVNETSGLVNNSPIKNFYSDPKTDLIRKVKLVVETCDELTTSVSNLKEKNRTLRNNNEILSQEVSQLHKLSLEKLTSEKEIEKERILLKKELEEVRIREKELAKKLQTDSGNFGKIIEEKQAVVDKYKEIIESKNQQIEAFQLQVRSKIDKVLQQKIEAEEKYKMLVEENKERERTTEERYQNLLNTTKNISSERDQLRNEIIYIRQQLDDLLEEKKKVDSELGTNIGQLKNELNEKSALLEKFRKKLTKYKNNLSTLQSNNEGLHSQLNSTVQEKEIKLQTFEKECLILQQKFERVEKEKEQLAKHLQTEIEVRDKSIDGLKMKTMELSDTAAEWEKRYKEIEQKMKLKDAQLVQQVQESKEQYLKQLQDLRTRVETDKSLHIKELENLLDEKNRMIESLNSSKQDLNSQLEQLQSKLKIESEKLVNMSKASANEIALLRKEVSIITSAKTNLEKQLSEAESELKLFKVRYKDLEMEYFTMKEDYEQAQKLLSNQLNILEVEKAKKEEEIKFIEQEKQGVRKQSSVLLEQSKTSIQRQQEEIKTLNTSITSLKEEIEEVSEEKKNLLLTIDGLKKGYETQLMMKDKAIGELKNQIYRRDGTLLDQNTYLKYIEELEAEVDTKEKEIIELQNSKNLLQRNLLSLKLELGRLKNGMINLKEVHQEFQEIVLDDMSASFQPVYKEVVRLMKEKKTLEDELAKTDEQPVSLKYEEQLKQLETEKKKTEDALLKSQQLYELSQRQINLLKGEIEKIRALEEMSDKDSTTSTQEDYSGLMD
ncbi:hypothetical protein ABK040_009796 [Willaertia magna]